LVDRVLACLTRRVEDGEVAGTLTALSLAVVGAQVPSADGSKSLHRDLLPCQHADRL